MYSILPPPPYTEARFQLSEAVKGGRSTLGDSERITGKWNKDDKVQQTLWTPLTYSCIAIHVKKITRKWNKDDKVQQTCGVRVVLVWLHIIRFSLVKKAIKGLVLVLVLVSQLK